MGTEELYVHGGHSSPHADLDSASFAPLSLGNHELGHFANVTSSDANSFGLDVSLMHQNLPIVTNHHALTETFSLPDDIKIDDFFEAVGSDCNQFLPVENDSWQSIRQETEKVFMSSEGSALDMMGLTRATNVAFPPLMTENLTCDRGKRPMIEYQQCQSLSSCTAGINLDTVASSSEQPFQIRKRNGMSDTMLASLSNVDPKRAKRIMANRQSAAKSKQKKLQYISELEKSVETLMAEKAILSAQLTLLREENNALRVQINELNLRLQLQGEYNRLRWESCKVLQEIERRNERRNQVTNNCERTMSCGSSSSGSN